MGQGTKFEYCQLPDGRVLWERGEDIEDWVVWDPETRSWIQATRIPGHALFEARPLTAEEVARLTTGSIQSS